LGNKEHDLARQQPEQLPGKGASHAPEPAIGVQERRPGVEADPHLPHDATAMRRWSVVVPTRAGWEHLARTLPPLLAILGAADEVVVVGDRCEAPLPATPDERCRIVVHGGPPGFAPACNRGAREARGRLLLFLNDDVVACAGLLDRLEDELLRPGVGAVSPDVFSELLGRSESGTTVTWHHGVLESRQEAVQGEGRVSAPYLSGARWRCAAMTFAPRLRRAPGTLLLGGPRPCLRVRESVGDTVVVGGVSVAHRHGATIGREPDSRRWAIYERNLLLVTWRHLHGWRWLSHLTWLPLRLAAGLVRDRAVPKGFLLAVVRLVSGSGRADRD
jgi:GT2 family glycosyltransferase